MSFHILGFLIFSLFFRPHVEIKGTDLLTLRNMPRWRSIQIVAIFLATMFSLYVYATRTTDKIGNKDGDELHSFSHLMRNLAFMTVIACWGLAFVIQITVIKLGIERVSKVSLDDDSNITGGVGAEDEDDEGDGEGENEDEGNTEERNSEVAPPPQLQELSATYIYIFKFFTYTLGYLSPWVHVAYRNYFSYYLVTLLEVPVILGFFLLFASAPKRWTERELVYMALPYPVFNIIVLLGDIISLSLTDDDGRDDVSLRDNIAGRLIIILCSFLFFPLVLDTSRRLKSSFTPQRTERFLQEVFSKALFMLVPILYLW